MSDQSHPGQIPRSPILAINVASIGSNVLIKHLLHSLTVNAGGVSGTAPNGQQGMRITRLALHCIDCDETLLSVPMP